MTNQNPQLSIKIIRPAEDIEQAPEKIYSFFMSIIKSWTPEAVLQEFNGLFIQHLGSTNSGAVEGLYEIVVASEEDVFYATLKRCCYILINNWKTTKQIKHIHSLVELFSNPSITKISLSPISNCLRGWLKKFVKSLDYQELKLFADKVVGQQNQQNKSSQHWSDRYSSYIFVAQSVNPKNSLEHREAAKERAKHLRYRFKFDLTMYLAHSGNDAQNAIAKNPTELGDNVLRLIKTIIAKREPGTYKKFAKIFIEQAKGQKYKHFKHSLYKYLSIFIDHEQLLNTLDLKISSLYEKHNEEILSDSLLIITCNRIIENLTTEDHRQPSPLFLLLISQGSALTLVTVLLKIILICKPAHSHLETCIADLIGYYENFKEEECDSMINFLEMYNIMLAIYGDSTNLL